MKQQEKESQLIRHIRQITDQRPTYGYRRVTAMLSKQRRDRGEPPVNHKKVYRLMKENRLLLPKYGRRPTRTHEGKIATLKSDLRWCSDAFGIQCFNGDRLQVVFILDCHDREVIRWASSTKGIDGSMIRDLLVEALEQRSKTFPLQHPIQFLSDNGPCYTARETIYFGRKLGFEMCTTAPYSPESNGMAEAFVKTFKRDYVYCSWLDSAQQVGQQLEQWFTDYNRKAPHKALGMIAPSEYRALKNAS